MALPFQIEYGQKIGRAELVGDAVAQMRSALSLLRDPETGLYRHGYDEARKQGWADALTGQSPALWTRAIGWMAMALVDIIALIGPRAAASSGLSTAAAALAQDIGRHQLADGRWNQVTDMPDLNGNYAEASGTAMLAYFYLKGARLGITGIDAARGQRALEALGELSLRPGPDGTLALQDICHVAGLGGFDGSYRDGTPAYYLSEPIAPNDIKGVGPLMMAVAERERAARAKAQLSAAS